MFFTLYCNEANFALENIEVKCPIVLQFPPGMLQMQCSHITDPGIYAMALVPLITRVGCINNRMIKVVDFSVVVLQK